MLPYFGKNSVLLIEPITGKELSVGDIALFERDGKLIVHRVVGVNERGAVLFSGDNNQGGDGWIPPERVKWRVAGILYSARL